ncbi:MAG: TetR/AcrR family transcriptional regulator [Pseudomonadales bacterium]
MSANTDNRRARSEATKQALMRAAEALMAEHGVENVSIRDIVTAAEQKNESALQYHFKNLAGLLTAIHDERSAQIRAERAEQIAALLERTATPNLRQVCTLMVAPNFQLARSDTGFRRYLKAFGHTVAFTEASPLKVVSRTGAGGKAGADLARLLKQSLPHLDKQDYLRRMEAAVLLCSAAMHHQARQASAFRGPKSELFLHSLIDALAGLLAAPVSRETKALK